MKLKTLLAAVLFFTVSLLISTQHQALADTGTPATAADPGTTQPASTQPAKLGASATGPADSTSTTPATNPPQVNQAPAPAPAPTPAQDPSQVPVLQIPPGFVLDPGPDPSAKQPSKPAANQNQNQNQGDKNVSFNFRQLQTVPQQAANTIKNLPASVRSTLIGSNPASGYNYDLNQLSPQTTKSLYGLGLALALIGLILATRSRKVTTQEPVAHGIRQFEIN